MFVGVVVGVCVWVCVCTVQSQNIGEIEPCFIVSLFVCFEFNVACTVHFQGANVFPHKPIECILTLVRTFTDCVAASLCTYCSTSHIDT